MFFQRLQSDGPVTGEKEIQCSLRFFVGLALDLLNFVCFSRPYDRAPILSPFLDCREFLDLLLH